MQDRLRLLLGKAEAILEANHSKKTNIPYNEFNYIVQDLRQFQKEFEIRDEEVRNIQKQTEYSLNRFALLYNQSTVGYVTLDQNSIILQTNQTFANMINKKSTEVINKFFSDFLTEDNRFLFLNKFKSFFKNPVNKSIELKMQKNGGGYFFVTLTGCTKIEKNIHENHNQINQELLVIITDITEHKLVEDVLQERELRYRTLVNSGQALIWTSGIDKGCYFFNTVWLQFTDRSFEQEFEFGWMEGVHKDDLERCVSIYNVAFDQRKPFSMIFRLRRYDGEYRWLQDDGCPRYNNSNEFIGFIGHCLDITDLKLAEEKALILTKAVENSPACIVITDISGNIEYVNPKFTEVTGYGFEEATGQNPRVLKSGKMQPEIYQNLWQTLMAGNEWRGELLNKKKNGDLYWEFASISGIKNENGKITHFIAVKENITERKKIEFEINQKNIELKDLNATKDKFFSIIAHDLKNPFNTILGFSELLVKNTENYDIEKIKKFATIISNSAVQTYKLLENLLEWSRLQRGLIIPNLQKYNLKSITEDICQLSREMANNKNITINNLIISDVFITCDIDMTKTVLRNLISNAIKFTNNEGIVTLDAIEQDANIEIHIMDTGVGIPEEKLPLLFKIDVNISTCGTAKEVGTGLGLLLCKDLIEKQDGEIWVHSQDGKGSNFYFTLKKVNEQNYFI